MNTVLHYSDSKEPGTFWTDINIWDAKNIMYCPACGKEWYTKQYNLLIEMGLPTEVLLKCHTDLGGCGGMWIVLFEYVKLQTQESSSSGVDET